uniref:DUF3300 domain-containing protein n=1 Tax=Candidatus Kentrum eta TaxID=2126337 RepID=A0A450UG35_9GAMM|nr:MAG: hypothetical protein BECKH772A_GA0070896_100319 [Candidatus Kentron sp. H]VFJ92481.1 MAG: hypothetical protein BECKH772B_GA0070898_1003010 [Candidatus Kentron sp. H]VFJ99253.1 MAG: hypothetical protein BECKH772C_GA0070978_100309 [Candidatus Kentron sp. H]
MPIASPIPSPLIPTFPTQRAIRPLSGPPARPAAPALSGLSSLAVAFFAVLALALAGCSNQYAQEAAKKASAVERQLAELGRQIDSEGLANTRLIKTYADELARRNPAFQEIAAQLRKDATTKGPLYQGLRRRLSKVNREPKNKQEFAMAWRELESLSAGADPVIFNDALLDVVNTLADLSQEALPRINVPKNAQTAAVKGGDGQVPGSYLVGNPAYGQWSSDSSGRGFWEWYGMYRMFTDVLGFMGGGMGGGFHRGPIYHNDWYSRPRHSFYHDAGRDTYGSRADRSTWRRGQGSLARQGITTPKPKNYGSVAGRKRVSTYAYRRANTSSALKSGRTPGSTRTSSRSTSTATKRRSSFFGASGRGTSRRSFRGK